MKKNKKLVSLLAAAAMAVTPLSVSVPVSAQQTASAGAVSLSDSKSISLAERCSSRYGYEFLGTLENGKALQTFYDKMYDIFLEVWESDKDYSTNYSPNDEIVEAGVVNYSELGLSSDQITYVHNILCHDAPLFYFISSRIVYNYNTMGCYIDKQYADAEYRAECKQKINAFLSAMTKGTDSLSSIYEKALIVQDRIIGIAQYPDTITNAPGLYNIMGIIENGLGVCESYSECFSLVMNYLGADTVLVIGNGSGEPHQWNVIKLDDGKYYHVDVTWNDTGRVSHEFFARGSDRFDKDHTTADSNGTTGVYFYDPPKIPQADFDYTKYVSKELVQLLEDYDFSFNDDDTATITKCNIDEKTITVPGTIFGMPVTVIDEYAFLNKMVCESITLPDTVREIKSGAFAFCYNLKDVNMPSSLETIGSDAFMYCTDMNVEKLPSKLTSIGSGAFYMMNLNNTTTITIPQSVKTIGDHSFGYESAAYGQINYKFDGDYSELLPQKANGYTIRCVKDSAAYKYAVKNGINYDLINGALPGDADSSGKMNINDVLLIQQKIAGWNVDIDEYASDVNADGRVNINDVLLIQQKIAGWNVELRLA